jgi:hypothetical protein
VQLPQSSQITLPPEIPIKRLPVFNRCTFAVIPKGRMVFPIFIRRNFSGVEPYRIGWFEYTVVKWYIHETNVFMPVNLELDCSNPWSGLLIEDRLFAELKIDLSSCAMTKLINPVSGGFQGKLFTGFLFIVEDLQPYVL